MVYCSGTIKDTVCPDVLRTLYHLFVKIPCFSGAAAPAINCNDIFSPFLSYAVTNSTRGPDHELQDKNRSAADERSDLYCHFVGLPSFFSSCALLCSVLKKAVPSASTYIPGKYSASLTLGNEHVNVEVTVDADQILDVSLVHLNEAVSTMYPLMQPSMNELAPQILNTQSTKDLTFPESSRYTCMTLLKAVDNALEKPGNKKTGTNLSKIYKRPPQRSSSSCGSLFSSFLFFRSIPIQSCKQFCRHIGRYFDPLFCIFF